MVTNKNQKTKQIAVKYKLYPEIYDSFKCIASDCKHTCCEGWTISISQKEWHDLQRLPKMPDFVGDKTVSDLVRRIPNGKGNMYAEFVKDKEGKCPFWNNEGLCSLQLEYGEDVLCKTCKTYPRISIPTYQAKELTLTPSCEAVLEQLWTKYNGLDFVMDELPKNQQKIMTISVSENMWRAFPQIHSLCIDILQCRSFNMSKRLLIIGLALKDLMKEFKHTSVSAWEQKWTSILQNPDVLLDLLNNIGGNDKLFVANNSGMLFKVLSNIGVNDLIKTVKKALEIKINEQRLTIETGKWKEIADKFSENYGDIEYFFENLMVLIAFNLVFPRVQTPEKLWTSYVELCSIYSLYRFISVAACFEKPTKEQLFHVLVLTSRAIMHNDKLREDVKEAFAKNNSDSLAHMAILVCS